MCWYRLTGGVCRSTGCVASVPAANESNSTRFSPARRNCQRPSDISSTIKPTVSSVVNTRGAKMREPILIATIYCLCDIQISRHRDAGADLDQPGQGAVPLDEPQSGRRRQDG